MNPFFLGLQLEPRTSEDLFRSMKQALERKQPVTLLYMNIHGAILALQDTALRDFYNRSETFVDGDGVRWGMQLAGCPAGPKVPVTRWIWEVAAFCETKGYRLYLLGGGEQIAQKASENLRRKFPRLQIVGTRDGYFQKSGEENARVIQEINASGADVVVVAFGMPVQEKWLMENRSKIQGPVCITGGGVLDYVSGKLGKAPDWMVRCHLEWLFRIYQEPRRLVGRYATEIPYFFFRVFGEIISRRSQK